MGTRRIQLRRAAGSAPGRPGPRITSGRRACRLVAAGLLCAASGATGAFEQAFDAPAFVVTVPGLPSIGLSAARPAGPAGVIAAHGADLTYTVEVTATPSAQAGSTRTCSGTFLRELVRRPHMPDRDSIYRAPFDANTFLVLYIVESQGSKVLHAHLLSAAAGSHCIDAHFSRSMVDGEDEDRWRATFAGARIREGAR